MIILVAIDTETECPTCQGGGDCCGTGRRVVPLAEVPEVQALVARLTELEHQVRRLRLLCEDRVRLEGEERE